VKTPRYIPLLAYLDQGGSGQDGQQSIYRPGETSGTPYLTIEECNLQATGRERRRLCEGFFLQSTTACRIAWRI
jgi:hypothetical protein